MQKLLRYAVAVNVLLALLFVYSNYLIWDVFNGNNALHRTVFATHWNPFTYSLTFYDYFSNGDADVVQGIFQYTNYPFWIFWASMTVNLYFLYRLQRIKETKPTKT